MKIYKQQDKDPLPPDIGNVGDQEVPEEALPENKQPQVDDEEEDAAS